MTAMKISDAIDQVIKDHMAQGKDTRELIEGPDSLLKQLTKAIVERCLDVAA